MVNLPGLVADVGSESECVDRLIELFATGKFLETLRADPLKTVTCYFVVVTSVLSRLSDHDHEPHVFGHSGLAPKYLNLANALEIPIPIQGGASKIVLRLVAEQLIKLLLQWLSEKQD